MEYEIKVLLIALAKIVKQSKSLEEVYEAIREMADAENVKIPPYNKDEN